LGGQVAAKKPTSQPRQQQTTNRGIDISKELDAINGTQCPEASSKGGIDIGDVLGAITGGKSSSSGGIDLGSVLGAITGGKSSDGGGIDLGSVLGAVTGGKGGLDLGSILGALVGGNQPSGGLTGSLSNANIGEIAQSVISVIGMASSAFGGAKQ
jgi:hypothetical protein